MKVFSNLKILSLFVIFFLMFNIFSLILNNIKNGEFIGLNVTEQFFSVKNFSDNIIKQMLSNKMFTNKQHKKDSKNSKKEQNNNKFYEFLLPSITLPVLSSSYFSFNMYAFVSFHVINYLSTEIEYPLKIPFLLCIFLMLILKMLFNILPRSISINYNKMYIERACIV